MWDFLQTLIATHGLLPVWGVLTQIVMTLSGWGVAYLLWRRDVERQVAGETRRETEINVRVESAAALNRASEALTRFSVVAEKETARTDVLVREIEELRRTVQACDAVRLVRQNSGGLPG